MSLFIVSNRLPITVNEEKGSLSIKESSGGLVTGMNSYLASVKKSSGDKSFYKWIGWPGKFISKRLQKEFKNVYDELNLKPVIISEKIMDKFYLGFCNKTIWPLFHYFLVYTVYDNELWEVYKNVNQIFADELLQTAKPGDTIWIHDYHLMLVPRLIRNKIPDATIGYFHHIPFPSYEIFRMLPKKWRMEILNGLLGADLIGFHIYDYVKHFLTCSQRILGLENNFNKLILSDRIVEADAFPMGIDYKGFQKMAESKEAGDERNKIIKQFNNSKIILSIDRLDYTKGILNRLMGYELFLEQNNDWHEKVNLLIIVIPSRIGVDRYSQMKRDIDEKVGHINSRFGNVHWTPIIYQFSSVDQLTLSGIYSASEIALVTPLRDGMNLISKEYLACKTDYTGVLILSEMAGASKELGEALIINPNNTEEIATSIKDALEMSIEQQRKRNMIMHKRLIRYDVYKWAELFINSLAEIKVAQKEWGSKMADKPIRKGIIEKFKTSKKAVLFLDYDGTLVPFEIMPEDANPSEALLKILSDLSSISKADIVLISGRDRSTLQNWFSSLNITLAAEHGSWVKEKGKDWVMQKLFNTEWKQKLNPFLERYTDLLPGSFVEEKNFALVLHYRKSDPEQSTVIAHELLDDLVHMTANMDVQVMKGNKVIEIRNNGANKGTVVNYLLENNNYDFVFAAGDDWTDEDMFKALPENANTIKIGLSSSYAKFNLAGFEDLRKLLIDLTNA